MAQAIIAMDIKLGSDTIKQGTKVKGITILDYPQDGHDIRGRVDGFGLLLLKSSVIKVDKIKMSRFTLNGSTHFISLNFEIVFELLMEKEWRLLYRLSPQLPLLST